jgi:Phage integrase family
MGFTPFNPSYGLSASAVATIIKQRATQIGLDPRRYSGHSLRAGFATSAAGAGLPVWKIKGQTGHVSDAVVGRYIRETDIFMGMEAIWLSGANAALPQDARTSTNKDQLAVWHLGAWERLRFHQRGHSRVPLFC